MSGTAIVRQVGGREVWALSDGWRGLVVGGPDIGSTMPLHGRGNPIGMASTMKVCRWPACVWRGRLFVGCQKVSRERTLTICQGMGFALGYIQDGASFKYVDGPQFGGVFNLSRSFRFRISDGVIKWSNRESDAIVVFEWLATALGFEVKDV